jgi:hypothetical protein
VTIRPCFWQWIIVISREYGFRGPYESGVTVTTGPRSAEAFRSSIRGLRSRPLSRGNSGYFYHSISGPRRGIS